MVSWSMGVSVECAATTSDTAIIPLTTEQIRQDQRSDPTIGHGIQCKLKNQKPSGPEMKQLNSQITCLLREWDKLEMSETGVLYRKTTNRKKLVLPKKHRSAVLRELNDKMGH